MIRPETEQQQDVSDAVNAADNVMLLNQLQADEAMLRAHAQQAKDEAFKVGDDGDGTVEKLNEQAVAMEELAKQMEATRAEIVRNPQKNFSAKVKNLQVKADISVVHVEGDLHEAEVKEELHEAHESTVKADAASKEKEKPKAVAADKPAAAAKEVTKTKTKSAVKKDKAPGAVKTIIVVFVPKNTLPQPHREAVHEHSLMQSAKEVCHETKKKYVDPILESSPTAAAVYQAVRHPIDTAEKMMNNAMEIGKSAIDTTVHQAKKAVDYTTKKVKEVVDYTVTTVNKAVDTSKHYAKSAIKMVTSGAIITATTTMAKDAANSMLKLLPSMPVMPNLLSFGDDEEEVKPVQKPAAKPKAVAKPKTATIISAKQIAVVKKVKEMKIPAGISKGSQVADHDDLPSPNHILELEDKELTHHS